MAAHASRRDPALVDVASGLASATSLGPEETDALRWAALLHDSGLSEAAIEASASSEPLSEEQLAKIREHPLRASLKVGQVGNLLWVARILETHHEHHNGWGYPFGLKGDEIPLPAALLGLAEAYLALVTPRPYRHKVMAPQQALAYLKTQAGEQFSPAAVTALETWLGSAEAADHPEASTQPQASAAADCLRRLAGKPRLPTHQSLTGPGSDLWFRGLGGPRRFFQRLFTWNPLRVRHTERDLPADWYRSLFDLSRALNSSLDVQLIARQLADATHSLTTLPCIVHLVKDDNVTLAPAAVAGLPPEAVSDLRQGIGEGLIGLAISESRPVTTLNLAEDPRAVQQEKARTLGVKSSVCVPLKAGDTALGAISVNSPTVRRFAPNEVRALVSLGNIGALALNNALLYRRAADRLDQLVDSQLYLSTVFDTVPAGLLALGPQGDLVSSNRQASQYLRDLDLNEAEGNLLTLLDERLGAKAPLEAWRSQRPCGPDTVSWPQPDGERFFEIWAAPLRDFGGRTTGILVVLDDVTEAERLAAEVRRTEKLAAVGEVAAKAAHEIKNPLAAIRGLTQLLGLYCPVQDQWKECPQYVGLVVGEVDRLTEIAQSMLTLARPARPQLAPGDLSTVVAEVLALLSGKASEQGTTLERAAGPIRPTGVAAEFDPRQLKQVLLNLVQNALDAVAGPGGPPPGWRKVTVSLGYTRRDERRQACIQVRDNGPGIRADDRPRVFTPFFTTKDTGTGLGLAISKSIVEAHGGIIDVRPARGRGCVFEVLLPVASKARAGGGSAGDPAAGAGLAAETQAPLLLGVPGAAERPEGEPEVGPDEPAAGPGKTGNGGASGKGDGGTSGGGSGGTLSGLGRRSIA